MQTGTAGDMILGGLFDLGLDFEEWKKQIDTLGLTGISLSLNKVSKHGIMAARFRCDIPHEHGHRGLSEITRIIQKSGVLPQAKKNAIAIFTRLAQAEATIHGVPVDTVHFHEVGGLDAIVDIVGACVGFEMLGIQEFFTTPFTFGTGSVQAAHGTLSVPVPATLALSQGFPSRRTQLPGELCTPTGTAIITTLARPLPLDFTAAVHKVGYGAGERNLPGIANVLRLCVMECDQKIVSTYAVYQVECNLDDMTPEMIAYAAERLLASGCKDVWQEPIFMKKNRGATKLCALVEPPILHDALSLFASETTTGGVRYFPVSRWVAEKSLETVVTHFGAVTMKKIVFENENVTRFAPEYESCRALAESVGAPLQEIYQAAMAQSALAQFASKEIQ